MANRLAWLAALMAGLAAPGSAPLAQGKLPPDLEYAQTRRQSSMVYVPHQGAANWGLIFFTEHVEEVSATAAYNGTFRYLTVSLIPSAVKDGTYTAFTNENGINRDDKVLPVPAFGQCQPAQAIKDLLSYMPDQYKPRIISSSWPFVCVLRVVFLPEYEQSVRDTIAKGRNVSLGASVPLCAPDSLTVDSPTIVQRLIAQQVLHAASNGYDVTGNLWEVLYASVGLALGEPALFGTPDPRDGWAALMRDSTLDLAAGTATLPGARTRYRGYVCRPAPLEILY